MAKVFFMKDGNELDRTIFIGDLFSSDATHHFGQYERDYSPDIPAIIKNTPDNENHDYQHVVVRIDSNEVCPAFPLAGCYRIKDLAVSAAKSLLDLAHQ